MKKSVELKDEEENIVKELFIISETKEPIVEDFLPEYRLKYEGIKLNDEAEAMAKSLIDFMKEHEDLVLNEYNSKSIEAVQEGYSRATAICELFIRTMYLD